MDPDRRQESRAERLQRLSVRCQARGLVLTEPRLAILEMVLDLDSHPTADEVHSASRERHPGIGRATVYRALESFVRVGVLTKASHLGAAIRYDADVDPHHHLLCLRCDRIIDLWDGRLDALAVPDTSQLGFEVTDVQVQLRGICRNCLPEEDPS